MRRVISAVVLSGLLAVCLGLFAGTEVSAGASGSSGALLAARTWVASGVMTLNKVRMPDFRRIFGRRAPTAVQQDGGSASGPATVQTDRADYHPYDQVIVTGSAWQPGELVSLLFHQTDTIRGPYTAPDRPKRAGADSSGNISDAQFWTDYHDIAIICTLAATGQSSGLTAETTFTDAASFNLDHCGNGPATAPVGCVDPTGDDR